MVDVEGKVGAGPLPLLLVGKMVGRPKPDKRELRQDDMHATYLLAR